MSLLSASKYVVPSHIHLGAFSGFGIISLNNLVNVKWDDEMTSNQESEILSIPGDFHFWDLVNAALTLFRMGGGSQKGPPTSFSPVTSTNVGIGS